MSTEFYYVAKSYGATSRQRTSDVTKRALTLFLADRTNGRAIGTVLRLSVSLSVVCDVMYCG